MTCDRDETQIGSGLRQQPQQVQDIRLLTRALTAEHVGIDGDEWPAHPIAFRYEATVASAAASQV